MIRPIVLTARDMDMLAFLALHRECPLELLAARFFSRNPFTGCENKNPLKQCARRLAELRAHGYLDTSRVRERHAGRARVVAHVASKADSPLNERAARRSVNPKERVHHLKTLDAVREIEERMKARGGRVVDFRVEAAIRAAAQRGRRTRGGDAFVAFPDAVCTVAFPASRGGERIVQIAVEYVTSKYASDDIRDKHASFAASYDEALWFADRRHTADRVARLTGETCSVLS